MRFGPYAPIEIDRLIPRLTARGVAFDLSFDDKSSKDDLSFSPANSLALAEFRTRNYTAQYFYFDIDDDICRRDPELVQLMEQYLHQQPGLQNIDSEDSGSELDDSRQGNVVEMTDTDSHDFRKDVRKVRRVRALLAAAALIGILIYWVLMFSRSFFAAS